MKIGSVAKVQGGTGFPKKFQNRKGLKYGFYKVGDISRAWNGRSTYLLGPEHTISEDILKEIKGAIVPKDSVVFAKIGEAVKLNRRAIAKDDCLVDNNVFALIPETKQILSRFLFYFMWTVDLAESCRATTVPSLRKSDVEDIELPDFRVDQQGKIVDAIETQFTRLDAAVKSLKAVKAKLEIYRQSVLHEAFKTGFSNTCAFNKLKLDDIKSSEKHSIKRGPFGGSLKKEIFVPQGYKVYEQKNAINNDFEIGKYFISAEKFQEMAVFKVKPGDFIISCSGTIGRIARVPEGAQEGIINQALLKIQINESVILPRYFQYLFKSDVIQKRLTKISRGVAIKNVPSVKDLKNLELSIPVIKEQIRIVDEIESRFSVIDKVEEVVDSTLLKADRLRKSILKSAFEGKLFKGD